MEPNFYDCFARVETVAAMIRREIDNRARLDALAADPAAVIPAEMQVIVVIDEAPFALADASRLGSFADLLPDLRAASAAAVHNLVADLEDASRALVDFCRRDEAPPPPADDLAEEFEPPPAGRKAARKSDPADVRSQLAPNTFGMGVADEA